MLNNLTRCILNGFDGYYTKKMQLLCIHKSCIYTCLSSASFQRPAASLQRQPHTFSICFPTTDLVFAYTIWYTRKRNAKKALQKPDLQKREQCPENPTYCPEMAGMVSICIKSLRNLTFRRLFTNSDSIFLPYE